MAVSAIPAGYHSVTPYLHIRGAAAAIEFYRRALGAVEVMRLEMPGGAIAHAEIKIGRSHVMLADESPEMGAVGPQTLNGTSVSLMVYVEDCDMQFEKAIAAGGKPIRPMADQFYGDRSGTFVDPFGHTWTVGTHKVDMTPAEIQAAMEQAMGG